MSQDIIADALNKIMNAKRSRKNSVKIKIYSNLLLNILKIMKSRGYVTGFKINEKEGFLEIKFANLNECRAIKPRFYVSVKEFDKYIRRFLPARDFGIILVSTNKGLITHKEAIEKKIGGALVAYFY